MASSCHVSVKPKKSKEEVKRLKMRKDSLLSDLVFNKERFSSLLEFEKNRVRKRFCQFTFRFFVRIIILKKTGPTFRAYSLTVASF